MNIPFFDLRRQYTQIAEEVESGVLEVLRGGQYIEGSAVKQLEQRLEDYLGVKHVITCGNGTDALRIGLLACGIKNGDEVITTPFSFFATAEAVAQIGAVPVFVDIDPVTFNIDPECIRRNITKKTRGILPVHIFGLPANMDEICDIAEEYHIPVIEDACQAIGAEYHGKKTGALGTVGCFSFYPTKNLGAFGDGGMITTDDDGIALTCRSLKAHAAGKNGALAYRHLTDEDVPELKELEEAGGLYDPCKYYNYLIGGNSRLDSVQAAVLLVKLDKLDEYNKRRGSIAKRYSEAFSHLPVQVPALLEGGCKTCWHQYAVLTGKKEELIGFLGKNGVGAGTFYPVPLHLQKAFGNLGYREGDLPVSEDVCSRSVCLPIFPELTDEEVSKVIKTVIAFFEQEG